MIIKDHINFIPNPLIGANIEQQGVRFPDMGSAYSSELICKAMACAKRFNIPVRRGCYAAMTGPSYETPAEIRFLRTIGADAVGMSTVPEVIVARHCSMNVFALSVITNMAADDNDHTPASHSDVMEQGAMAQEKMRKLFSSLIASI